MRSMAESLHIIAPTYWKTKDRLSFAQFSALGERGTQHKYKKG